VSIRRGAATLGGAAILGHVSQFAWLAFGSRTMSSATFGAVLAAQALYGFLQIAIDNGPGFYGARLAASRRIDANTRGSIVRVRLLLALGSAGLALAIGAAAGTRSLEATAPFAVALVLFGALNFWEPYGLGDVRPWSAYVVLRSLAPAGAALVLFLLGHPFPLVLAGIAECCVIVLVSVAFGLSGRAGVFWALSARGGPWRSVTRIGLPVVIGQAGFAAGTILLNATGAATAAAVFAVSIRLVTGINQLTGTFATALFPHLARSDRSEDVEALGVGAAVRALVVLSFGASAVLMFRPMIVTSLFLPHVGGSANAATILTLATSCATGFIVLFTLVLLARNGENAFLGVYCTATSLVIAGGIVVALSPGPRAVMMAFVFVSGQVAGMFVLSRRVVAAIPHARRTVQRAATASVVLAAIGLASATMPALRHPAAIATGLAAMIAATAPVTRRRLGAPAPETASGF
jgi:O-antigen/teichoic acid export membrane protein